MKFTTTHPTYGEIYLELGFWSGKYRLFVGGVEAKKTGKMTFELADPEGDHPTPVALNGGYLKGHTLTIGNETIEISPKARWYDYVCGIIPAVIMFLFVGGAIGGGIGGAMAVTTTIIVTPLPSVKHKALISLGMSAISVVVGLILSVLLAMLFQSLGWT